MKIKEVLEKTTVFFKDRKIPSARLDAEILISHGLKLKRIDLYLNYDQPLKDSELEQLRALVKRRGQGEPVAYILGEKEFYGLPFKVSADVLIPRPETELLVEKALAWINQKSFDHPVRVLDLGCGSGCVGIAVASRAKNTLVTMIDLSEKALAQAQINVHLHGLNERIECLQSNATDEAWLASPARKFSHKSFDIILANPPYIDRADPNIESDVKKFEPEMALFADENGLQYLKAWSEFSEKYLASEAFMAMEIGASQGTEMYDHFKMLSCFADVQIVEDLAGLDRVVLGVKYG